MPLLYRPIRQNQLPLPVQLVILVVALRKQLFGDVAAVAVQAVGAALLFDQLTVKQNLLVLIIIYGTDSRNVRYFAIVLSVFHLHYLLYAPYPELILELQFLVLVKLPEIEITLAEVIEKELAAVAVVKEIEDGLAQEALYYLKIITPLRLKQLLIYAPVFQFHFQHF